MQWIFLLLGLLAPMLAAAQVSGSAALVSDYRFRGVTLSAHRPAAQFDAAYDAAGGAYGGIFLSNVRFADDAPERLQMLAYGGYALRLEGGASLDAGATYAMFPGLIDYNYGEIHLGIVANDISARLSYAPDYFGQSNRSVYAEVNIARGLAPHLELLGHAGALALLAGPTDHQRIHADASIELGYALDSLHLHAGRVFCNGVAGTYPVADHASHGAWTAQISTSF